MGPKTLQGLICPSTCSECQSRRKSASVSRSKNTSVKLARRAGNLALFFAVFHPANGFNRVPPNLFSILKRAALQIITGRRKHSFSTVSASSRHSSVHQRVTTSLRKTITQLSNPSQSASGDAFMSRQLSLDTMNLLFFCM